MLRLYFQLFLGFVVVIFQYSEAALAQERLSAIKLGTSAQEPVHGRPVIVSSLKQVTESNSVGNLLQQLNLTHQQKQKIKQIRQQYQAQIIQLKENLSVAQQHLATMMAGTDSVTVIRAKHEEIAQFRQQLATLHFESMLATREILTPQQRQKFAEIMKANE